MELLEVVWGDNVKVEYLSEFSDFHGLRVEKNW
jgi:hypothetical protein